MAYKNYISVMWNVWKQKNKIKVVLKNGNLYYVKRNKVLHYPLFIANKNIHVVNPGLDGNVFKFTYNGKDLTFDSESDCDVGGVFGLEEYSFLKVNYLMLKH